MFFPEDHEFLFFCLFFVDPGMGPAGAVALFQLISDSIREKNGDFHSRSVLVFFTTQNCGINNCESFIIYIKISQLKDRYIYICVLFVQWEGSKWYFHLLLKTVLVHT